MSDWREVFEQRRGGTPAQRATEALDDGIVLGEDAVYRPWVLQRGRGRPLMFIDLRRVEPRTGMHIGCQMGYPHLVAMDYLGSKMVTLDFGVRQFVIEGEGLDELMPYLQQGLVLTIQEYSPKLWPERPPGAVVTKIVQVGVGCTTSRSAPD